MKVFIFSCTVILQALSALPQLPIVQNGEAVMNLQGDSLVVAASNGAIIEWDNFSIQEGECTRFIQPDVQSIVLNRIISQLPSEIFGKLEANGQILLVNPNGIIFGKEARIDVGNLVASTLEIRNEQFIGKNWVFSGNSTAKICQMGQIHAKDVFLVAKAIDQIGTINARGSVGVGLGKEVLIQPDSNQKVTVSIGDMGASFLQKGDLSGQIFFSAPLGEGVISGTLRGNEIRISAEVLRVEDGANLQSSLIHLGEKDGEVKRLYCAPHTTFHADAGDTGNGGEILFWAKEDARFYGLATARGGKTGGNGGQIELSSPGTIEYKGRVDTLAPIGRTGHFLLDPSTINITNGPSAPLFANPYNPAAAVANLDVADLNAALMASSVTIATSSGVGGTGDINVMPFAIINVDPLSVGNIQLFLYADNDLNIQENVIATGPCSIGPQFDFRANANGMGSTGVLKVGYSGQVSDIFVDAADGRIDLSGRAIVIGDTNVSAGRSVRVRAQGANGTANIASTGDFSIIGNNTNGPVFPQSSVESSQAMVFNSGGNCNLLAGSGGQSGVLLSSGGTMTMVVSGDLSLQGGGSAVNNDSQAIIDSGLTQNIRVANDIFLQGGNGSNTDVIIQSSGSQTIDCSRLIDLRGGPLYTGAINGTKAQIKALTAGLNQEVRARQLHMTGGEDTNSDCEIISNGPQAILIAQDIVMQGGIGGVPAVNGTKTNIETLNGGNQIINAGSLSLTSGLCVNSQASIHSTGDQTIFSSGPISLLGVGLFSTGVLIRCDAVQTITGASLTLTGASEVSIIMPGAQNFNIGGDVLLQALPSLGGGILNLSGFNNPQTAQIGGSLSIIGAVASNMSLQNGSSSFMNIGGDLTLLGNGGIVDLTSDLGGNTVIQVGGNLLIDTTTGTNADINQNVNFQMTVSGNAVIGTGSSQGSQSIGTGGSFLIAIQGDLTIEGGSGAGANSGIDSANSFTGLSTIIVGGNGTLLGGSGSDADAYIQITSDAQISIGNNLSLTGGGGSNAGSIIETGIGSQQLFVGRSINLTGGTSPGGGAIAAILTTVGAQQVSSGQDIFLNAGSGAATNHAILGAGWFDTMPFLGFTTPDNSSSQVSAFRSIVSQNNGSGSRAHFDVLVSGVPAFGFIPPTKNGALTIQAGADITMASSFAATEIIFTSIPEDFIYINSDQAFAAGVAWPANTHPFLVGTPLAAASPAQGSNGFGGFSVNTAPIGGPISLTSQRGYIYLSSAERFFNGVLDNLTIGAGNNELTLTSINGNISVDPFHNINVANAVVTGGDVFMIAQNDISFTPAGSIAAGGGVILVCDNQFPAVPFLGGGAFTMESGSTITTGSIKGPSPLQIFTSRRSQNSILGNFPLNGSPFSAGAFLIDSNTEHWCVYYPDSFYGGVYTVFYKECLGILTAQANVINSEFFLDLHPVDEYMGRQERFAISSNMDEEIPFYEAYQIRRRKLHLFHYPDESTALFW